MTENHTDIPRIFRLPDTVTDRRLMLDEPHIAPLAKYVNDLRRKYPAWEFQDFDPCDGGVNADILFLMEKPGPMTSPIGKGKRKGSGFISRDNNDPTAEAVFNFMRQAEIDRERTVLWNVIPGWNGTIGIKNVQTNELRLGVEELTNLMMLLPRLRTVVLVGKRASKAEKFLASMNVTIFTSAHPSPKVRSMKREMWDLIPKQWAAAGSA